MDSFESAILGGDVLYNADSDDEEYVKQCVDIVRNMSDELMKDLCQAAKRYSLTQFGKDAEYQMSNDNFAKE